MATIDLLDLAPVALLWRLHRNEAHIVVILIFPLCRSIGFCVAVHCGPFVSVKKIRTVVIRENGLAYAFVKRVAVVFVIVAGVAAGTEVDRIKYCA